MQGNPFWASTLIAGIGYTITNIWSTNYFPWTSNLGKICLLISATILVKLIQDDLILAATFADYLKQSNRAFNHLDQTNITKTSLTSRILNSAGVSKTGANTSEIELTTVYKQTITINEHYEHQENQL